MPDASRSQFAHVRLARREVLDTRAVIDADVVIAAGFRVRSVEQGPRASGTVVLGTNRHAA